MCNTCTRLYFWCAMHVLLALAPRNTHKYRGHMKRKCGAFEKFQRTFCKEFVKLGVTLLVHTHGVHNLLKL